MGACSPKIIQDNLDTSDSESSEDSVSPGSAVEAFSKMGIQLLRDITRSDKASSAFVSPVSIGLALAMAATGARGETLDGMMSALCTQNLGGLESLKKDVPSLMSALASKDPRVTFHLANSVWSNTLMDTFIAMCAHTFHAEARRDVPLPGPVNKWCSGRTKGKIAQVLDPSVALDPQGAVLVNALYFKGAWKDKFNERLTVDAEFRNASGPSACRLMTAKGKNGKFLYAETNTYQVAALPYGDSGEYSAVLVLPRDGETQTLTLKGKRKRPDVAALAPRAASVDEVLLALVSDWPTLPAQLTLTKGDLKFPRFRVEFERQLNQDLEARGMAQAFTDAADFGNMSSIRLKIQKVIHKTVVEVNEEGTEAAAVTAVAMAKCASVRVNPPEPSFTMVCNRPFLFFLRHTPTSAMLFVGKVAKLA